MPLSVLLVDDEPLARAGLRMLLEPDAEIGDIFEARTGREAIALIDAHAPALVFLDVQMPELDGFGVVAAVGAERMPEVVFVTAHDQYAVAAFEISAVDYLRKPVTAARFAQALARGKARALARSSHDAAAQVRALLELMTTLAAPAGAPVTVSATAPPPPLGPARVAVRAGDRTTFVDIDAIEWVQSAENYVELHLTTGGTEAPLLHVTMNALERALDPRRFVRIHRALLVQLARVTELRPVGHGEYQVKLASGVTLRSGRTYHARIKELLRNPF